MTMRQRRAKEMGKVQERRKMGQQQPKIGQTEISIEPKH
jgi:hypothetical protein